VGVVVGILALASILFGVWFLLRRRRQHQAEEDYRRNAANVNAFVNGGKLHTSNSSMNDSRLDPSFVDRRQSNGSIADNEDYSRRILKVCHPMTPHDGMQPTNSLLGYQRISASTKATSATRALFMSTLFHDWRR
jgi:cell wall integrity and stress response component